MEDTEKINESDEKINENPNDSLIFSGDKKAIEAPPPKVTFYRKKGRKRTVEKTRLLFALYRIPRNRWPEDMDYQMCLYYTAHYIREDGDKHALFCQWKKETEQAYGKRFRVSQSVRP